MLAIHHLGTSGSSSAVKHQKNFQNAGLISFKQQGSRKFSTISIFIQKIFAKLVINFLRRKINMALPYATEYQLSILERTIDKKIKEAVINGVDTNPTKLSELQNDVGYITNSALTAYARKVEIPTRVSQLQNDSKYITNAALNGYAKTSDLSALATKEEVNAIAANIPSTDGLATEAQLNEVKNSIPTDYVTTAAAANFALKTEIPDVSGFATTTQLEAVEANIPTDVVTSAQLNSVEEKIPTDYLTQESLENYALKSEIPNVSGFATTAEVEAVANNIPTDYVPTSTLTNYALKTEIPDVSNFVTDAELNAVAANIPSIDGLATEAQVNAVVANIPTDYIPNSQLTTLATKEEVETKQDKIVEISGTFGTDGTGEKKVSGEFTETEGGQALALNFYNLGAPTFIRFNPMSYNKKIYTAEELYAWFGVTDVASLRGAVSRSNIFVLAFGIASMGIGHMQYRIPAQYIEVSTDELPQIIIKAFGPDYSNDKLCQYIITANTDGTAFGDTNCNIQVEKIAIQS